MSDTPVCNYCGAAAHPTEAARCANGHTLAGHPGPALTHGARRYEQHGERVLPTDLRVSLDDFRSQIINDRGGADQLTEIERGYIRRLAELETVARLLAADLASKGLTTARGRVRAVYSRWLETLDRWDRYAQRVGADRRARRVPSLDQYLAEHGDNR